MSQSSTHDMTLRSQQHLVSQTPTWDDFEKLRCTITQQGEDHKTQIQELQQKTDKQIQALQEKNEDLSRQLQQVKHEMVGTATTREQSGGDSKGGDSAGMADPSASKMHKSTEGTHQVSSLERLKDIQKQQEEKNRQIVKNINMKDAMGDHLSNVILRQELNALKKDVEKLNNELEINSEQDFPHTESFQGSKKREKVRVTNVCKVVEEQRSAVDAMLKRIDTLETQKSKLETEISSMKTTMLELPSAIKTLEEEFKKLKDWQTETDDKLGDLKTKLVGVTDQQNQDRSKLEHLEKKAELSSRAVSFHARLHSSKHTQEPKVLVCEDVIHNENSGYKSGGYDSTTGFFTCPESGTYCFLATASPNRNNDSITAAVEIVAERDVVGWLCAYGFRSSTVHSVVTLEKGERVWLRTAPGEHHFAGDWWTSFSGMLLKTGLEAERPEQG